MMPSFGIFPRTAQRSSSASSRTTDARPFTRNVSSNPGTRNRRPTFAFSVMFVSVSTRLLPGRSGMKIVLSSSIWTNPGPSPRGETSAFPSAFAVPIVRNGERPMNSREYLSSFGIAFWTARSIGVPITSRTAASSASTVEVS